MYSNTTLATPLLTGGAVLAYTGLNGSVIWLLCAAFALLAVGGALLRVAPSLHSTPTPGRHGVLRRVAVRTRS